MAAQPQYFALKATKIWDTAGQERFRALRTPFYRGSDICMLCYAIDDRESLESLRQWRREFLTYADVKTNNFPFIVVGNKNDLDAQHRQISYHEVRKWCDAQNITSLIETSSKMSVNVNDAFALAVRQWKNMERIAEKELREQQDGETIVLTNTIYLAKNHYCCSGAEKPTNTTDDNDIYNDFNSRDESQKDYKSSPRRFIGRVRQKTSAPTATNERL